METQNFSIFLSSETKYSEKLSVTVSNRLPGCSRAIESLISALTARVLQLYAIVPTRAGVFTAVTQKICNYWPMNKLILGGGLVAIALEELIIVPLVYLLSKC